MTRSRATSVLHVRASGVRLMISIGLGVLFLYAGLAKLVRVHDFERAVDTLLVTTLGGSGLPLSEMRVAGTAGVIAIEVLLGVTLIVLARAPRFAGLLAVGVLSLFTVALISMAFMESPPSCGCLGSWDAIQTSARAGIVAGIVRNVGLGVLALWLALPCAQAEPPTHGHTPFARANGFTLIEILVSISVIAVIIAIALPALRDSRQRARKLALLSEMRQALAGVFAYADQGNGYLPYLAHPRQPDRGAMANTVWRDLPPTYFRGQSGLWATALHRTGIDLSILSHAYIPENKPDRVWTWFWMTHAAFARPEYWVGEDVPDDPSLYVGVRLDEATFPSAKGLLFDVASFSSLEPNAKDYKAGFADGSAGFFSAAQPPLIVEHLNRPYGAAPWRVLTTEHGIRGRDFNDR